MPGLGPVEPALTPLILGCKLSVLGLGGLTRRGLDGPKSRGGVALLSSSRSAASASSSAKSGASRFLIACPLLGVSLSSSTNLGASPGGFLGQFTPYVRAISSRYPLTSA